MTVFVDEEVVLGILAMEPGQPVLYEGGLAYVREHRAPKPMALIEVYRDKRMVEVKRLSLTELYKTLTVVPADEERVRQVMES